MSEEALNSILSEREKSDFCSLRDFFTRTEVNRPIVENLIKVGAFDYLGNREELMQELPRLIEAKPKVGKIAGLLFAEMKAEPVLATVFSDQKINMIAERDFLSLTLPEQPFDFFQLGDDFTRMRDLRSIPAGKSVKIAGSVIRYQTPPTRNGNRVVYVIMEDGTGIADVTVFSDTQRKCGDVLFKEVFLVVKGKVQRRGPKSLSIIADELEPLGGYKTAV